MNGIVKDYRCNGCGNPLKIPKNSRGHVTCPSCKTDCVLEGLVKNAEMADKENINSGFPLFASPATLHRKLVSFLSETPYIPLDVFNKGEVVREEHYCVPAYLFYCNGTASYTYEAGNVRQHKTAIDLGDRTRVETENYMEWTQMNGTANVSATLFTSGNRTITSQVQELYMFLDPNKLIDFDELDFPHDVVTYDYNLPQAASFNEYVKPYMEELLQYQAEKDLENKDTRNMSMGGGSRIDKDEIIRVFLGLYRVVFKYGDKEYSMWATGDGEKAFHEGMPEDTQRQKTLEEQQKNIDEKKELQSAMPGSNKGCLITILVACIIGALFTKGVTLIGAVICVIVLITSRNKWEEREEERAKALQEIKEIEDRLNTFKTQSTNIVDEFKKQKKSLHGIYEEVTGDASAF